MSFDNATCPASSLPYSRSRMSIGSSTQCSSSSVSSESPHEPYSSFHFQPGSAFGTYHGDALRLKIDPYQDITSDDISPSPATSCQASPVEQVVAKRGRGRPRKHPIIPPPDPDDTKSSVKNRSKTGCLTCRRRKKKCDESKPTCLNCQKNNAICEGYPQLQPWQTRKNRKSKGRQETSGLPILIDGVENDADRRALDHFNLKLSKKLNPWKDGENPFHNIVFPMALSHLGLMHSLLCLSACHLSQLEPEDREMEQRHLHHKDIALNILLAEENLHPPPNAQPSHIDDPTIAQLLMFCLESACAGAKDGEHHYHMNAARHVLSTQRSNNAEFHRFILDLFMFHDVSSSITSLNRPPIPLMEDFHLPDFIPTEAGTLFGVLDGLFGYISKITNLRNRIRERRNSGLRPFIDYDTLSDAQMVDADLRCWRNPQKKGTERYAAAMLYHLCTWIYLHRTVLPSVPNHSLRDAVDDGLRYVNQLSQDESSAQAILLMPVFLLGCAAFEWRQRPEILEAFDRLAAYRCSRNIGHTRTVVQLLWQMMDQGDEDSWDWETLMQRMGLDFLVT